MLIIATLAVIVLGLIIWLAPRNNKDQFRFKPKKMIVNIENINVKDTELKTPLVINSGLLQTENRNNLYISKWNTGLIRIDSKGKQRNVYPVSGREEIGGVSVNSKGDIYIGTADIGAIGETDVVTKARIVKVNRKGDVLKTINPPEEAYETVAIRGNTIITSNFHIHGSTTRKIKTFSIFFLNASGKVKRKISVDKYIQNASRVSLDKHDNIYFAKSSDKQLTIFKLNKLGKLLGKLSLKANRSINETIVFTGTDQFGSVYVAIDRPNYKYPIAIVRKYTINGILIKEIKHKAGLDQYKVTSEGKIYLLQTKTNKDITNLHRLN